MKARYSKRWQNKQSIEITHCQGVAIASTQLPLSSAAVAEEKGCCSSWCRAVVPPRHRLQGTLSKQVHPWQPTVVIGTGYLLSMSALNNLNLQPGGFSNLELQLRRWHCSYPVQSFAPTRLDHSTPNNQGPDSWISSSITPEARRALARNEETHICPCQQ